MANQIGLELLPDACRVVEVQTSTGWLGRNRAGTGSSRVKAFHEVPYSPDHPGACAAELHRLLGGRGRDVRMALWGLRSTHQVFHLPQADTADLEMMARREARGRAGGQAATAGTVAHADGVMVGEHTDAGRREVGYVSVSPAELLGRLQPFTSAGIAIGSVMTPAAAHALMVRQRWGGFSESTTAVLSVNSRATAMTVVRGGVVLFTRELPWGYQTEQGERGGSFDAPSFAGQLAAELRRSLVFLKQQSKVDVGHVLVCGDLADLRSLTGPLMHELNVEVETLDSLEGFDVAHLPEPADEFRTRIGALRTAWALAAMPSTSLNLQPRETGAARFTPTFDSDTRRRVIVAALAGLLIVGLAWGGSRFLTSRSTGDVAASRRQIGTLEPEVRRLETNRQALAMMGVRSAALQAFATQGPRLALVLEALAKDTPGDVVITSLKVLPGVGTWKVTINGQAFADTPALAQGVFNQFLRGATTSPLLGQPVLPPSINVATDEPQRALLNAGAGGGGGAPLVTDDELTPLARPRNVVVEEEWTGLTAQERAAALALGRRPQRVAPEPHWRLHPGGVPKEVLQGIAAYNAEQANWEQLVAKSVAPAVPDLPVVPRAASMLNFIIEFEVRK
jgi:hypothetical protein